MENSLKTLKSDLKSDRTSNSKFKSKSEGLVGKVPIALSKELKRATGLLNNL